VRAFVTLLTAAALLSACSDPRCAYEVPEAPDEESVLNHLLREFHGCDAGLEVGMATFSAELLPQMDELAASDWSEPQSWSAEPLSWGDVARLPDPEAGVAPPDADGFVVAGHTDCALPELEALLVRADQDVVREQESDWDRTYLGSRQDFEAAWEAQEFAPVGARVERFDADFDPRVAPSSLLSMGDVVTPLLFGMSSGQVAYDTDLRHRTLTSDGAHQGLRVSLELQVMRSSTPGDGLGDGLVQDYGLRILLDDPEGGSWLTEARWQEHDTLILNGDSTLPAVLPPHAMEFRVERLMAVCSGEVELPDEP